MTETTDIARPVVSESAERGTVLVSLCILDSTVDETPIRDDPDFLARIENGLGQMERGESVSFEEVFGRPF